MFYLHVIFKTWKGVGKADEIQDIAQGETPSSLEFNNLFKSTKTIWYVISIYLKVTKKETFPYSSSRVNVH